MGKTSGRGHKGQRARSGGRKHPSFEGGQVPLLRRLPKFGFKPPFPTETIVLSLCDLDRFESGGVVDREALVKIRLVGRRRKGPIKVLANGELTKPLTVRLQAFSAKAKEAIEKAGGKVEIVS